VTHLREPIGQDLAKLLEILSRYLALRRARENLSKKTDQRTLCSGAIGWQFSIVHSQLRSGLYGGPFGAPSLSAPRATHEVVSRAQFPATQPNRRGGWRPLRPTAWRRRL
jgi:hypothetical protein